MIKATIEGIAPLLQHRYLGVEKQLETVDQRSGSKQTEYSLEWLESMFATKDGYLYEPASHIEQCMVQAASNFRIKGAGKKTWKDTFLGGVVITEKKISLMRDKKKVVAPNEKTVVYNDYEADVFVDIQPTRVNRARVARARVCINTGWQLGFSIEVLDEQLPKEVVRAVLEFGGLHKGIGDYRPKYGRFKIVSFE